MEIDVNPRMAAEQQRLAAKWHYDGEQLEEIRKLGSRLETLCAISVLVCTLGGMTFGIIVGGNSDATLQAITAVLGAALGFLASFAVFTRQRLSAMSTRFMCEKLAGR